MDKIYSQYLADKQTAQLCGDDALIRKMLEVEIALAKVQAKLGIIPAKAASEISTQLSQLQVKPEELAAGTLANGIPVIPLLNLAKKDLSDSSKDYLHWGATSQDIVDTATILMIREVLTVFEGRIRHIIEALTQLEAKHKDTPMVGRTRTQQAVAITFGQKIRDWLRPLQRNVDRLTELKPRLLVVQFAGAAGNLSAFDEKGIDTAQELAKEMGLKYIGNWHAQRDNIAEFAAWLALLSGALGKMAKDVTLLAQTEIGELQENRKGGGKSSTMPHKNNPVLSEAMLALSHQISQLSTHFLQAMIHSNERDGTALALEWMTLPQMLKKCGAMLNHALTISQNMLINEIAMLENLERSNGLIFSEKASFILAKIMARSEAKMIVAKACQISIEKDLHLAVVLDRMVPYLHIEWGKLLTVKT